MPDKPEPVEPFDVYPVDEKSGPNYVSYLIEVYKLYVESSQRISDRRLTASNFLLAANSALMTTFGIAAGLWGRNAWLLAIIAAGIIICAVWASIIRAYGNLNYAKFQVIFDLERSLPAAPFTREWKLCRDQKEHRYMPVSRLESLVPYVFVALYLLFGVILGARLLR